MTTETPLARYSAVNGALTSGSKPPSYTTRWDTTEHIIDGQRRYNHFIRWEAI